MSERTVYLVIKTTIQTDTEMSDTDLQEIVNELDYDIKSDTANVTNTEIMAALEKPPAGI